MRIASFQIHNYKGVAFARADGLGSETVITISGRNGTGKSHVLEALAASWNGHTSLGHAAGSWGDTVQTSIEVVLTDREWTLVDHWMGQRGEAAPDRTQKLEMSATALKGDLYEDGVLHPAITTDSQVMRHLLDKSFKHQHRFALIDFVPARRQLGSGREASVDLSMLALKQIDQQRDSMLSDILDHGNSLSLPTAASYLMTLDYQDHLARREGMEIHQYERIVRTFETATGKQIRKPRYATDTGGAIDVELANGMVHNVSGLSSGEQEMIAMMFSVKRLSATGGVMLMDEPEQHLHPSLQATLFDAMKDLSASAQILVVTHSVNLISAANPGGLIEVAAAVSVQDNQVMRLADHPEKIDLVAKLGLSAGDYFQNDMFLVVEGETDAKWLRELFPLQLGRAHIIVAGSAKQVLEAHRTLASLSPGLPWLCVTDRDLRSDAEVAQLRSEFPRLFVWPRRAIENMCMEPALIRKTMKNVGKDYGDEDIRDILSRAGEQLKDEVVAIAVRLELQRTIPSGVPSSDGDKFAKAEASYRHMSEVNRKRADSFAETLKAVRESIESRWESEWLTLVNPHSLLGSLHAQFGGYENSSTFMSALISVAREQEPMPAGLESFKRRLVEILATAPS